MVLVNPQTLLESLGGNLDAVICGESENNKGTKRTVVALLLDASGSMSELASSSQRTKILELNQALADFKKDLCEYSSDVDILVIEVKGSARVVSPFQDIKDWEPPVLVAGGQTALGQSVSLALQELRQYKDSARRFNRRFHRPFLVILSDGKPNDAGWEGIAEKCAQAERDKGVCVLPLAIEGTCEEHHANLLRFSSGEVPVGPPSSISKHLKALSTSVKSGTLNGIAYSPLQ